MQKLYLHQAALDSIEVSESEVIQRVDYMTNMYIANIGSREKMEEYFNKTSSQIRETLRENAREGLKVQKMQQKLVGEIKITPAEVRRPKDKLEIQILDDSTDDTTEQCYRKVEELKSRGFDAVCIHRTDRTGFKAGALEASEPLAKMAGWSPRAGSTSIASNCLTRMSVFCLKASASASVHQLFMLPALSN